MSKERNIDRRVAAGAVGVAVVALGVAGVLWAANAGSDGDEGSGQAIASQETAPAPEVVEGESVDEAVTEPIAEGGSAAERMTTGAQNLPLPEDCRLSVSRAVLTSDPTASAGYQELGLGLKTIGPAVNSGVDAHALSVLSTTRVDCDLTQGVVALRGGINFRNGDKVVELRRPRIDFSDGSVAGFPSSVPEGSFIVSEINPDTIDRIEQPGEVTAVVPMRATRHLSETLNAALGADIWSPGDVMGTMAITATRNEVSEG